MLIDSLIYVHIYTAKAMSKVSYGNVRTALEIRVWKYAFDF